MKRKQFNIWRHHSIIFTGNISEIKEYLLNNTGGAFEDYRDEIINCRWARFNGYGRFSKHELNYYCCMTEYCCIDFIDKDKTNGTEIISNAQ
jgi:hypothetical protein